MAILVLGGAGYIGSHTVYELIDAGRDVVVADNLQTGFRAAVHPKARFYQLDIRDKGALDTLFQAEHIEGQGGAGHPVPGRAHRRGDPLRRLLPGGGVHGGPAEVL